MALDARQRLSAHHHCTSMPNLNGRHTADSCEYTSGQNNDTVFSSQLYYTQWSVLTSPKNQTKLYESVLKHNLSNLITAAIVSSKRAVERNLREMLPVSSQPHFRLLQN